jgi:hypothetical protein
MRSMFSVAPFSRFDLGRHVLRGGLGAPRASLGQQFPSIYALEDYAQKIEGLTDTTTKNKLREQYKECREKEGAGQIACYAVLGAQVYEALKNEGRESTLPPPIVAPQQPASEFPIIPITIAVLAAGGLIYFLATQGKKKS